MNCKSVKSKLLDYHKGKLSFEDYKKIKMHIDACDDCAKSLYTVINDIQRQRPKMPNFFSKRTALAIVSLIMLLAIVAMVTGRLDFLSSQQASFGEVVDVTAVSNNIEFTITHAAADEEQTIVYFEIKDLENAHNFYVDIEDIDIDSNMVRPFFMKNDGDGVNRGELFLLSLLEEEKTIPIRINRVYRSKDPTIEPYSIEWYAPTNQVVVEGVWELEVPIKKREQLIYPLNETIQLNGVNVDLTQITVSPTKTAVTYQYKYDNSNEHNLDINLSHLEANGKRYEKQREHSELFDDILSRTISFDSIFYNRPKDVEIYFANMYQSVANQVKIDFDYRNVPHTFTYMGESITIAEIEVGNPTKILVIEDAHPKRDYNFLNINSSYFHFDGEYNLYEVATSGEGVWLDNTGQVQDPLAYQGASPLRYFTTEHFFEITTEKGSAPFKPTFLYIEGYTIETSLNERLKVSLD
ncbi:MAG: DUF5643 domain-containing protein [Anaerobacillus sp.]|uniref:DUF5643 domain-containing protein n=1 Tax=Anaerobacillus sp. TaxID=1872506 RepID=UPI003919542D